MAAGPKRHKHVCAEWNLLGHGAGFFHQRDLFTIHRHAVELRPESSRKRIELIERADGGKSFRIELDTGVRRIDTSTPARGFLGITRMRRAVGAEKKLRAAAQHGMHQRLTMLLAFDN